MAGAGQTQAADPVTVVFQNGLNGYEGTFARRIGPAGEGDGCEVGDAMNYSPDGGSSTLNDAGYIQGLIRFGGALQNGG